MKTAGQIIGIFALIVAIISLQQRERKGILGMQMVSCVLFVLHFSLLGAFTGAMMNGIGLVRCFVFYHKGKPWASHLAWPFGIAAASVVACILTWQNIFTIFPMIAMLATTLSLWVSEARKVRLFTLPSAPLWFTYNVLNNSYAGMMTEVFSFISLSIAIFRYDILPPIRQKKKAANESAR